VAKVVADLGPHAVGELDDPGRTAKLEAAVAAAGWRELRVDDGTGAPLASGVETAIVAEELSRGVADVAFLGPTLAAELRRRAGAEPADGPEALALAPDLGGLTVDDEVTAVDAAAASTAVAVTGDGSLHAVAIGGAEHRTDLTRTVAGPLALAGAAAVPSQRPLSDDDLAAVTALGLALTSAELVGTMQGALELAAEYAKERRQYGVAVGSFQAVQHLLADAAVAVEGARSLVLHAAWSVDALAADEALASGAAAKAYASRAARTVCETAIQVHGGIGNTWECLAHVHLRRALLSIDCFGGVGPSLARVLAHHGIGGAGGLR
jgi:hypothetical protein